LALGTKRGLQGLTSYGLLAVGRKKQHNVAFLSPVLFPIYLSIILPKEVVTFFSKVGKLNIRYYQYFIGFGG